jgi:UDP-N-acetylglucosamine--dolichyl-phosphate N-acetylglucosaminephosphotransferase
MLLLLILSAAISFITTFLIAPYFMQFLHMGGIVGLDLHKKDRRKLPTSGGICVAFGILAGLLSYIGINTFVYNSQGDIVSLLVFISTVLIGTFVGFLDDLNVKPKAVITKEGLDIRIGFPQWLKPLLTLPAAIPLMVINAGETIMELPLIGSVNFGILYPLILIPIGVVGASNVVNLLGGFNGSESGMGIVYLFFLSIHSLIAGNIGVVIFLTSTAALLGFIKYNWYPAKFLPGDSLTYLLGTVVAAGVIVGNMERVGVIMMALFIVEFFLKMRSKFKASSLGRLRKDGKLDPPYKKIYSITHVIMKIRHMTEKQVTICLIALQLIVAFFSLLRFF